MQSDANRRVYRREPAAPAGRPTRPAPRRRKKKKSALPLVLALALMVLLVGVLFMLLAGGGNAKAKNNASQLAVLDDDWTASFLQRTTDADRTQYLQDTLTEVQSLGGSGVLWTARAADGSLLFRPESSAKDQVNETIAKTDGLFHHYDPLNELIKAAAKQGMSVLLLPTDAAGQVLEQADLSQCAPTVLAAAKKHGALLCAPGEALNESIQRYYACTYKLGDASQVYLRCDESGPALAAAMEQQGYDRVILGDLTALRQDSSNADMLNLLLSSDAAGGSLPDLSSALRGLSISSELAVSYPTGDIYTDTCFLMGTSDPSLPLTIQGATVGEDAVTVERGGSKGVWGFLVSLNEGDNTFTLSQAGGSTLTYTVTKPAPSTSGGGAGRIQSDGSVPAVWGQRVRITTEGCASALNEYGNPDSINATLYTGATAAVYNSEQFVRSGKYTYAYQLSNGSYVLAKDVELLDADTPTPTLTGGEVSYDPLTRCTAITYQGGTPAVTHEWEADGLTLNFLNCQYEGAAPVSSGFIADSSVENLDGGMGFVLRIKFTASDPLYGWSVGYDQEADTTTIYLKHKPTLSAEEGQPLSGIRVLLDPGHGQDDNGAMGSAGYSAPVEKDVNLAEALAAKHRLEQLGATVIMTRSDDTFYTLAERLQMLNEVKPDFFIAVHHNSAGLTSDLNGSGGTECYWFYTEGKPLAEALANSVSAATGRRNRGTAYNYYFVTRSNICPAVLLESGFMTVPSEYESCVDTAALWAEGGAIAQSVLACVKAG